MEKITKAQLVDAVYSKSVYEKQTVQAVIDGFLDSLNDTLMKGNTIELRGFGTFETRLRKGRGNARNPKTGEICGSQPHYTVCFRAGKSLKETLLKLKVEDEKK